MIGRDPQQIWSERKARIVGAYAAAFAASLSAGATVWLVDAWAGAAQYGDTRLGFSGGATPGAALQIAELAAHLAGRDGRAWRSLALSAQGAADAAALEAALAPLKATAEVMGGSWGEQSAAVLRRLGGGAALVLLDGGDATVPIVGGLDGLARRLPKTEALARYDRASVAALLAAREAAEDVTARFAAERALDQTFATRQWRMVAEGASDAEERDLQLRDLYAQMLVELGGGRFKWAAACPIRAAWGALEYDLVFATPDRAAGAAMNAVLYAIEGRRDEQPETALLARSAGRPQQIGLFDQAPPTAAALRDAKIAAVAESLRIVCETQPRLWGYADLFDQLLRGGWFGQIAPDHCQAACKRLAREGRLERVNKGKTWDAKTLLRLKRLSEPAEPAQGDAAD